MSRKRKTKRSIIWGDRGAKALITLSGLGVIAAISMVGFFLLWITLPLFLKTKAESAKTTVFQEASPNLSSTTGFLVNEPQNMAAAMNDKGDLTTFSLQGGQALSHQKIISEKLLAFSLQKNQPNWVGISDTQKLFWGQLAFGTAFLEAPELPPNIQNLQPGEEGILNDQVILRTSEGQWRAHRLSVSVNKPIPLKEKGEILAITHSPIAGRFPPLRVVWIARDASGAIQGHLLHVDQTVSLMDGETTTDYHFYHFDFPTLKARPRFIQLSDLGDQIFVGLTDATLLRFNARDLENISLAETLHFFPDEPGVALTAMDFVIGKATLLAGNENGNIRSFFLIQDANAPTEDGRVLVHANSFQLGNAALLTLEPSQRSRIFAATDANGQTALFHATTAARLATFGSTSKETLATVISPKNDAVWTFSPQGFSQFKINLRHPEVSFHSLFFPVHYEGYPKAEHVWQSSSGSDDSEPKFGMMPLIFGTIKATFYSLLFGVPIALLAAIYTSEFLNRRYKNKVKPAIELMASLPSVVLGFLAASVFSPWIEHHLSALLLSFVFVPGFLLLVSYAWKFFPYTFKKRLFAFRMPFIALVIFGSLFLSQKFSGLFETCFFAGNLKLWLGHQIGRAFGGWVYLLMPLGLCFGIFSAFRILEFLNEEPFSLPNAPIFKILMERPVLIDILKFALGLVLSVVFTISAAYLLELLGFDPRGMFLGTYVQRNALVVGFVMGFAIIPLIYTLAEDALSMVPNHLRTASLGAGATVWQTTRYVVIPAAMGGIFSAIMIGLGRAVGETMIVLMAAGNTPIMSWDVFKGFRTLSANIAVELPEAVKNSTHYRALFLSALILFAMTFALNMLAEWVRQRFRKKVSQL